MRIVEKFTNIVENIGRDHINNLFETTDSIDNMYCAGCGRQSHEIVDRIILDGRYNFKVIIGCECGSLTELNVKYNNDGESFTAMLDNRELV